MDRVGLLFGSFNPIHQGHLAIAQNALECEGMHEVWFVISPQNPLKNVADLAPEQHRLRMVEIALEPFASRMKVCTIEFGMPRPSYTIDTLRRLAELHPNREFHPIIGADSLASIERWKDHQVLLKNFGVLVFPREGVNLDELAVRYKVQPMRAPLQRISSTQIREAILLGGNAKRFLPQGVLDYIHDARLYGHK